MFNFSGDTYTVTELDIPRIAQQSVCNDFEAVAVNAIILTVLGTRDQFTNPSVAIPKLFSPLLHAMSLINNYRLQPIALSETQYCYVKIASTLLTQLQCTFFGLAYTTWMSSLRMSQTEHSVSPVSAIAFKPSFSHEST